MNYVKKLVSRLAHRVGFFLHKEIEPLRMKLDMSRSIVDVCGYLAWNLCIYLFLSERSHQMTYL